MKTDKKELRQKNLIITALTSWIILTGFSHANVIFYQGFDYGDSEGNLCTIGSADWSTSSPKDVLYKTTSLEHEGSPKTGGSAKTQSTWTGSSNTTVQDFDDISLIGTNEFWVSVLISSDSPTPGASTTAGITMSIVENSWQGSHSYTVAKNYGNTNGYSFAASGTGANITNATFATVGTNTVRIVYHVKKSTQPEVWVNPTTEPIEGTGQSIGVTTQGSLTKIEKISISFLGIVLNMDEFVIGETYADVCAPPPQGSIFYIK